MMTTHQASQKSSRSELQEAERGIGSICQGKVDPYGYVPAKDAPQPIPFRVIHRQFYELELQLRDDGEAVYHFYPRRGRQVFPFSVDVFGMLLEDAYVWAIDAPGVSADFFGRPDSQSFLRMSDPNKPNTQETFCIRVPNVANRMFAERVIIDRFCGRLDALLERAQHECLQGKSPTVLENEIYHRRWRH